ncbi:ParB N-terminal domain-containing protein [Ilumatobacter nonamiensis]|uniref:ParB N-terminal domain-containing protein n=1 Tax=Ilumatobacter nonamiensis TaxID=467093 RepID=UPI0003476FE3|nr:ParB N-terminal domain-containing protein [Ilumatobacter nonamiensis]
MSDQEFTVESARSASEAGRLDDWVARFLASDGSDNAELGKELSGEYDDWTGPVRLPFDRLHRLAGPPDQPTLDRLTDDDEETVEAMEESVDDGWVPPPFVATWQDDHLVLEDGNHRAEGLRRAGQDSYWCVVGFDGPEARSRFEAEFE